MELMSLLLATLFVAPPVAAPDPEPGMGRDAFGDALPFGAVARYGTIRYRAGGQRQVVFSRDGKTLLSDGVGGYLYLWATDTGKLIRRYKAFGPGGHASSRKSASAVSDRNGYYLVDLPFGTSDTSTLVVDGDEFAIGVIELGRPAGDLGSV